MLKFGVRRLTYVSTYMPRTAVLTHWFRMAYKLRPTFMILILMTLKKDICIGVGMYVELRQDTPSIPYTIARLKRNSPSDPSGLSL